MNIYPDNSGFMLKPLALGLALVLGFGTVHAKSVSEASTLLEAMGDPNESKLMKNSGLKVGAWLNTGVTYNAANPDNNFNGPVTFADRANELQLNQINLFIQRAVATEGKSFDFGGRFDIMYGSDSIFTQAYGVPAYDVNTGEVKERSNWDLNLLRGSSRFYDIAMPQAYLEAYLPFGNGINVKLGHFYTPIGFETVPAPDNFFYTHAYTMQYGEPFTHTGIMGNYAIDGNWSVMGGAITGSATGGWDGGWDRQLGNWAGLMGATWTSDSKGTSANISGTYGGTSEQSSKSWAMYSMVLKHNITDKTHLMLQHDHGYADGALTPKGVKDAEWYGINTHLYYDLHEQVTVGVRAEWFRDNDGIRVCSPGRVGAATNDNAGVPVSSAANFLSSCQPASYYAVTVGANWKPLKWLNIRPNVRYDWVDGTIAGTDQAYLPFGNGKDDQFLFSTDMTITF